MTVSKTEPINSFTYSANSMMNESIIFLGMLQMFLAAGISSIKRFQAPVELLLLSILIYGCMTVIKYDRWQQLLLFTFPYVTVMSFFTSDKSIFLVNAKQNGLAVFSLLYFSRVQFKSRLIFPTFVLTLSLMIINKVAPPITSPLISLTFNDDFNSTRFGGVFLNAHYNAYFMAVPLIYYGYKRNLYGVGAYIMYFTASKFVFVSYLANVAARLPVFKFLIKYRFIAFTVAILAVYLCIKNSAALIDFFDTPRTGSAAVILMQVFDPVYYTSLLHPFPADMVDVADQAKALYKRHDGFNEIGFFALGTHSGFILASLYLGLLLKYTRNYRVFILVSLLHYGYVQSPLIVYMLVNYSREIERLKALGAEKKRSRLSVFLGRIRYDGVVLEPK